MAAATVVVNAQKNVGVMKREVWNYSSIPLAYLLQLALFSCKVTFILRAREEALVHVW